MRAIITFTKVSLPYGWLGNMGPFPIYYNYKNWRTSEALFQAYRFAEEDPIREEIRAQTSPMTAKMVAKKNVDRMVIKPMSVEDLELMTMVLRLKVEAHPNLKQLLLDTDDAELIEDTTRRANVSGLFWGAARQEDGSWKGQNYLGKLWMLLRNELTLS